MNKIYLAIVAIVAVVGFFVAFKYTSSASSNTQQLDQPQAKTFDLVVQKRKLVAGPSALSVTQNDNVTIKITVDEDEELHLHGYNLHIDLQKGEPGELSFVASSSGRFPYELEHSSTEIGALEVQPQ
jgi:hypothetical protein